MKIESSSLFRYISFFDEQETVKKFRQQVLRTQPAVAAADFLHVPVKPGNKLATCRNRLWNIIDNNESSMIAKVFLWGDDTLSRERQLV